MNKKNNPTKKIPRIYAFLAILLALLITFFAITQNNFFKITLSPEEKPSIAVTIFPFFSLTKELVPENVEISWLLFGKDAHSFTPQPRDLEKLQQTKILIYGSESMSPWIDKVRDTLSKETLVINLSEGIEEDLLASNHEDEHHDQAHNKDKHHEDEHHDQAHNEDKHHEDEHHDQAHNEDKHHEDEHHDQAHNEDKHHEDEHHDQAHNEDKHHDHGEFDPHFWLDFSLASKTIDYLSANLVKALPEQKSIIETKKKALQERLSALDQKYKTGLANCQSTDFYLLGHNSFSYLARRYALNYTPFIENLSTQAEPRLQSFVGITSEIEKKKINYVFYEEYEKSDKNLSLVENAKVELLPLSNGAILTQNQIDQEMNFFTLMESNLANLKKGLNCQ